jgi:hypothetical protein
MVEGISSTNQGTVAIVSEQVIVNSLSAYPSDRTSHMKLGIQYIDVTRRGNIISVKKLAGQRLI